MLRKYITGSHYGIILRNDLMELYYAIILMKRIHGMPGTSPETPGIPGVPWARSWDAGDAPGTPGQAPGAPGDAPGAPGDAPGTPRHAPGTPGTSWETPGTPL